MRAFRIADGRFPIFSGMGARLIGGRWNSPGHGVIYAAETFAGAILEILVHANLNRLPLRHAFVEITIPENLKTESMAGEDLSGWDAADQIASRAFGDRWIQERRSSVLLIPSIVTGGHERNVLINPEHGDFRRISATDPEPVRWDQRLFKHLP
jgi:RES domain-containing protein